MLYLVIKELTTLQIVIKNQNKNKKLKMGYKEVHYAIITN